MMKFFILTLCASVLGLSVACSNPADNKPRATINEPAATPAASASSPTADSGTTAATSTTSTTTVPTAAGQTFKFTPDSKITFKASKVTKTHEGGFGKFTGEIRTDGQNVQSSSINVQIETASVFTDAERLTGHLKTPDFFDVAKFPQATFQSTQITKAADGYLVTGNFTLHGVTKSITFPAKIELSPTQAAAQAEFVINRADFNIVYPGKPDDLIRNEVVMKLDIKAVPG
jgi:polyisoprenoid-binding protein YceI